MKAQEQLTEHQVQIYSLRHLLSPSVMAAAAPSVAAVAAAAAATTSSSSTSSAQQTTDLATGIIVVIVLASVVFAFLLGLIWFCVRRRRTKRRRADLLKHAQEQTNAENARFSRQPGYPQSPPQENGPYQGYQGQAKGYVNEMPTYPTQTPLEKDGENRYEVLTPPPRASELYSPPATAEMSTGPPPSSELDGSYGSLPTGPNSEVSSPMLRREHEQIYSDSWKAAGSGA